MEPLAPPGRSARLIAVPKKRLPAQGVAALGRERFSAFVEATQPPQGDVAGGDSGDGGAKALIATLGASTYETKTRGTRHQGAARLLAEAAYVIGRGGSR